MSESNQSPMLRRASAADVAEFVDIFYATEFGEQHEDLNLPPPPPIFSYIVEAGEVTVAELAGAIVGFAGIVARGTTAFLTDLFVHPRQQSSGIGGTLLRAAFAPHHGKTWFTVSSADPRAQALYIRHGLQPRWPNFVLRAPVSQLKPGAPAQLTAVLADPGDPALVEWDTRISGRPRPQDLDFWHRTHGAVTLWLRHDTTTVGYAVIRLKEGTLLLPDAARIGPVGVSDAAYAIDGMLAAVQWAARRAPALAIDLPGPHPALAPLLDAGFQISYVETFVSNMAPPFDPQRYAGSGGSLF